jgi:hypothetical protein
MNYEKYSDNQIKVVKTVVMEEVKSFESILSDKKNIEAEISRLTHQNDEIIAKLQGELDAVDDMLSECEKMAIKAKPVEVVKVEEPVEEELKEEEPVEEKFIPEKIKPE